MIEFDLFEWSDIANNDSGKCFSTFGHGDRPCLINQICMTDMIYAEKGPNMTVLTNGLNVLNVQVGHVDKVKGNEGTVGTGETG